jgi:hypothetical protein
MPRIITALFENHAQAQRALQAMMEAGVTRDRITLVGRDPSSEVSSISGFRELSARDDTLVELHDLPLPEEDLREFERGLRSGCSLLSARVDGSNIDEAIQVIEMFDPLDLDRQSREWQQEDKRRGSGSGVDLGGPLGAGLTGGTSAAGTNVESSPGMSAMADDPSVLGASDARTDEAGLSDQGRSTMPTGQRRAEERSGAPGVLELGAQGDAQLATKVSPNAAGTAGMGLNAGPDLFRRETNRSGRVRAYSRD